MNALFAHEVLDAFETGEEISRDGATALLAERDAELTERLYATADAERKKTVGDEVSYVINANVNFTNVCYTDCKYCGFWRRPNAPDAYTHDDGVLREKFERARDFGVREICMQGGLNPQISIDRYEEVLRLAREVIRAFTCTPIRPRKSTISSEKPGCPSKWCSRASRKRVSGPSPEQQPRYSWRG